MGQAEHIVGGQAPWLPGSFPDFSKLLEGFDAPPTLLPPSDVVPLSSSSPVRILPTGSQTDHGFFCTTETFLGPLLAQIHLRFCQLWPDSTHLDLKNLNAAVTPHVVSAGLQKQMSSSLFLRSMQDSCAAEEAGALPKWLLQMLSQDEREGLLRLSIFPLAITLEMATSVLPSTCKPRCADAAAASVACCCCCCLLWHGVVCRLLHGFIMVTYSLCLHNHAAEFSRVLLAARHWCCCAALCLC